MTNASTGSPARALLWPRNALIAFARRLADLALPPRCLGCGGPIAEHRGLCGACWRDVDFIEPPLCDRLGIPLPFDLAGDARPVSAAALADPPAYDRARAVARYSGVMRRLIHDLKYRDQQVGLDLFARWLEHAGADLIDDADLLVPVPLHVSRLWSRRFNQSAMLAARLARACGKASDPTVLRRSKRTRSQVGLTADQRTRNLRGAIAVRSGGEEALAGRAILLIDDVITTGSTANACARALRKAGVARVDVLALARVVDPLDTTL